MGVMAYEAMHGVGGWGEIGVKGRAAWAAVESAIRADERAKVIEECAKELDARAQMYRAKAGKHDSAAADTVTEHERFVSNSEACERAAADIRELGSEDNG